MNTSPHNKAETLGALCCPDGIHEELPPQAQVAVELRTVYGRPLAYPDNQRAKVFCDLLGQATLKVLDLKRIELLGFQIVERYNRDWRTAQ